MVIRLFIYFLISTANVLDNSSFFISILTSYSQLKDLIFNSPSLISFGTIWSSLKLLAPIWSCLEPFGALQSHFRAVKRHHLEPF